MKKKILLFYPLLNRSKTERDYHWFPYSVIPLAKELEECGFDPIIFDHRIADLPNLQDLLSETLFAGISAMSGYQVADGLKIAQLIRKINPSIPLVWGGWHATILPEETLQHPNVDYVITGRGEPIIGEFSLALSQKELPSNIKGVGYIDSHNQIHFNGYRKPEPFYDQAQAYEKYISIEKYVNPETMALGYFSGHGCSFQCGFCSRHFMTNHYSPLPMDQVISDLTYYIRKYGFRFIHFQDDNFFLNIDRAMQIAQRCIDEQLPITWWANIRADVIPKLKEDQLKKLIQSGMNSLFIGVESASKELLLRINKGISSNDIYETNNILKYYPVRMDLSYILGLPGDSIKNLNQTTQQILELKRENPNIRAGFSYYQPYPGTPLYEESIEAGYPRISGLENWAKMKPQSEILDIPWLNKEDMQTYRNLLAQFRTEYQHLENQQKG